jgi:hypothetical protein
MADNSGKLSEAEKTKAIQWVLGHWKTNSPCPICAAKNWNVADHLTQPLTFSHGTTMISGPAYPQVQVICSSCGYTIYFNAVMAGLVEAPKSETQENEPGLMGTARAGHGLPI